MCISRSLDRKLERLEIGIDAADDSDGENSEEALVESQASAITNTPGSVLHLEMLLEDKYDHIRVWE